MASPRPTKANLVLPIVLLAIFVMPISIAGTALTLTAVAEDLGDSPAGLQWVVNGFNLSVTLGTLAWGAVAGRLGYRRVFAVGNAVMVAGSVLSFTAPNLLILDIGRVLAGVGAAAIVTGGPALISHAFTGKARARAFALLGTTIGVGLAAAPTIAGLLVSAVGWRGIFALLGGVSLLMLLATGFLPTSETVKEPGRVKILDFSPLRSRAFTAAMLVPVAGSVAYVAVLTYLPVALSAVRGMDARQAGLYMLFLTLPVLVAPMLATSLIHRVSGITPARIIRASLALLVAGDLLMLLFTPTMPLAVLIVPMLLLGFGWGLPVGLIDGEALAAVRPAAAGAAAGVLNFARLGSETLAVAGFAAALSSLLVGATGDTALAYSAAAGGPGAAAPYADTFRLLMVILAVVTTAISVWVLLLQRAQHRATSRIDELAVEQA